MLTCQHCGSDLDQDYDDHDTRVQPVVCTYCKTINVIDDQGARLGTWSELYDAPFPVVEEDNRLVLGI